MGICLLMNLSISSSQLSKAIKQLPKEKLVIVERAVVELQRKRLQERSWSFIPIKPEDKNGFDLPSNDQLGFYNSVADEQWAFGGNRSGKTEIVVQKVDAFCNGRHPILNGTGTIERDNGTLYRQKMPPIKGRYCAPKWRDGIKGVVLQKFKEVCRRSELLGGSWVKAWSETEHRLYYKNGSFIHMKSGEEDLDTFGGTDLDFCAQDERLRYSYFLENKMRLADRDGIYMGAMTPEAGLTWEEDHILTPSEGVALDYWFFSSLGNPHISTEAIKKIKAGIKDDRLIEAKIYGRFVALSGLVIPQFDRKAHLVSDYEIPHEWPRVFCIDTHIKTPSAAIWVAWKPDGTMVVYRTVKRPYTIPEWQKFIKVQSLHENIVLWMGDEPGGGSGENIWGKESVVKEFTKGDNGIPLVTIGSESDKSFTGGIYKLWDFFTVDMNGKTKVEIFKSCDHSMEYYNGKTCPSLPWELEHYQYKTEHKADEETLREKVRLVHNHYIDGLRYIAVAGQRGIVQEITSAIGSNWS